MLQNPKEELIRQLLEAGSIDESGADLLRAEPDDLEHLRQLCEIAPYMLVRLARRLGLDPDHIIGYPAEKAFCRGYQHPWKNTSLSDNQKEHRRASRSSVCVCCGKDRERVPDTNAYSGRLWVWRYPHSEDDDHVPRNMSKEEHRQNWDKLEAAVNTHLAKASRPQPARSARSAR